MTKTVTYPRFVDVDRNGVFQKVFVTSNGNEEWCSLLDVSYKKVRMLWTTGSNTRTVKGNFTTVDSFYH